MSSGGVAGPTSAHLSALTEGGKYMPPHGQHRMAGDANVADPTSALNGLVMEAAKTEKVSLRGRVVTMGGEETGCAEESHADAKSMCDEILRILLKI
jgi:hypothetical protein